MHVSGLLESITLGLRKSYYLNFLLEIDLDVIKSRISFVEDREVRRKIIAI